MQFDSARRETDWHRQEALSRRAQTSTQFFRQLGRVARPLVGSVAIITAYVFALRLISLPAASRSPQRHCRAWRNSGCNRSRSGGAGLRVQIGFGRQARVAVSRANRDIAHRWKNGWPALCRSDLGNERWQRSRCESLCACPRSCPGRYPVPQARGHRLERYRKTQRHHHDPKTQHARRQRRRRV